MPRRFTHASAFISPSLALMLLLAWPIAAFAHGAQSPGLSDGTLYILPEGVGWFGMIYDVIQREMEALLRSVNENNKLGPVLSILMLAFGYGVVHAIGPGHGKLLLASYMTATRASANTGIAIAFAAAAFQGLVAISIVLLLAVGMKALADVVPALQGYVSIVSLILLAAFGLAIMFRQLALLKLLPAGLARHAPQTTCGCCASHAMSPAHVQDHDNTNVPAAHMSPNGPQNKPRTKSQLFEALALAASMGARPCTSAFAILLLALAQGVLWLGIMATAVMALGVAVTLSVIAVASADMRDRAHASQSRWVSEKVLSVLSLGAGSLLASLAIAGLVTAGTS